MNLSLNDSLRAEFKEILNTHDLKEIIEKNKLDNIIISGALEKLLSGDNFINSHEEDIEKARSEFENYIINTLKIRKNNDNK